jgi:hypothetical protein
MAIGMMEPPVKCRRGVEDAYNGADTAQSSVG